MAAVCAHFGHHHESGRTLGPWFELLRSLCGTFGRFAEPELGGQKRAWQKGYFSTWNRLNVENISLADPWFELLIVRESCGPPHKIWKVA